jgi:xanthine dehydrogenase small subunit
MSAYHRPATLDEALKVLFGTRAPLTVLAGGTDIYPARTARLAWGALEPVDILDLSAIKDLRGIKDCGDYWWIGALTTWSDIIAADLPPLFDCLKSAARDIGGVQIQNRGTIGGNICTASPAGDAIPCLMALDAEIECIDATPFRVPIDRFYTGYRTTILDGEIVTGVRIPKQPGRSVFRKLGARRYLVISIAMVAVVIDTSADGRITHARCAVGACSATAQRLPLLEAALIGRACDPALALPEHFASLTPIDDIRATAAYRREVALTLTRDCLSELAVMPKQEAAHG